MKRILITGGAGFIGSHIADRLLKEGHNVLILDDFSGGDPDNIRHLFGKPGFKLLRADVRDRNVISQALHDIDVVFHLAAQIHIDKSIIDPVETIDVNVKGTLSVLDGCMQNDIEQLVIASSSEVYGTAMKPSIDEEHPLNPFSPYAASKAAADRLAFSYWKTYGMNVSILRVFNTFGPRQRSSGYGGVISIFLERVSAGLPPVIYGDGNQTRDYLYIEDTVEAYMQAMKAGKSIAGCPINIGTGIESSILEIALKVIKLQGRANLTPVHIEPRPGEVLRLRANTKLAKEKLGFMAKWNFDEGLADFAKWYPAHGVKQWSKSG